MSRKAGQEKLKRHDNINIAKNIIATFLLTITMETKKLRQKNKSSLFPSTMTENV